MGPREEVPPMTAELVEDVTLRMPVGRDWTYEDLLELPDDGRRYEVVDGSLHVSPAPWPRHQVAASRLVGLLEEAAPDDLDAFHAVGVDCGRNVLQPDVVVARADVLETDAVQLAPADLRLAVEVVSPSSVQMDRLVKPAVLAQAGVPAYWRVELDGPGTPLVVVYSLDGDVYREVGTVPSGETVIVDVPFPVELRPADLVGPRRKG
jgi:Uma2 family endonuclease